ncbi:MAG: GntR family transcriptional regulator [Rhodobacteraceae bacterium]|nr:GntR family transcriptional regulator [Paracoccaceae bacterium]MCF8512814.1 GntR family transcriptional regulator [Paracoccaceae bacterium]MCF8517059.1 GntR family transcriptional regulator [Paracoccaceae bacterium]
MVDARKQAMPEQDVTAVAEWVAGVLRDRIVKGHLLPGARIVERKLSAELDVSRTPIREALKILHSDKLIEISRNRGAQVADYGPQQALDLFDVIASLEGLAAERLAVTITRPDLEMLEDLHAQMLVYYRIGNTEDYFDTNSAIHDAILTLCGNPILADAHAKLMARARRGRFMAIMNPNRWGQAVGEHEELMAALRSRDGDAARKIWRNHLMHTGRTVADVLLQSENAPKGGSRP